MCWAGLLVRSSRLELLSSQRHLLASDMAGRAANLAVGCHIKVRAYDVFDVFVPSSCMGETHTEALGRSMANTNHA